MYYLKLYNQTLLTFDMDNLIDLKISNINVIEENRKIFPITLSKEITEDTIIDFLKSRVIPKNRFFVEEILKTRDLSTQDTKGIIDVCKGLSLNDSYWIVEDDNLRFEDYNLYDNNFSETLSLVAFTGYGSKIKGIVTSPEFTTNGALPKAWRRIDNEIYLYKGSTEYLKFKNAGNEPYSEFYSSQVAKAMGIDMVEYGITKWKGILCSTCKLFTTKDISFVPIIHLMETRGIEGAYNVYKKYGLEKQFGDIIAFDSLIYNYDRHFGNFGMLRNNLTGKIYKNAPIFDNGAGLFPLALDEEMKDLDTFKNTYIKENPDFNKSNYGSDYNNLVKLFCTDEQIKSLRKLLTFKFEKNELYNLPDERLKTMSSFIQERARELISIIEDKYKKKEEIIENNEETNIDNTENEEFINENTDINNVGDEEDDDWFEE